LRYDLEALSTQTTELEINMEMRVLMMGEWREQPMPRIRTTSRVIDAALIEGGERARLRIEVGNMQVAGGGDADVEMSAQIDDSLGQISFEGEMLIDERGNLESSSFDLSDVDGPMRQQLESTVQSMKQSVVPFPADPVGVGATWTSVADIELPEMSMSQSTTYRVLSIGENSVRIQATVTQRADAQALNVPNPPEGAEVILLEFSGNGTGDTTIRFDQALPEGEFTTTNETTVRVSGAESESMDVTTHLEMSGSLRTLDR